MSTSVVEVTRLEDLVTFDPPPCQALFYSKTTKKRRECGKPSAYRVKASCVCGMRCARFICGPCFQEFKVGKVSCDLCYRQLTDWQTI